MTDERVIVSVTEEAVPRINTAARQIAALVHDLLEEQQIEPRAVFLALGRVAGSYPQWAVTRVLLGMGWMRMDKEHDYRKYLEEELSK